MTVRPHTNSRAIDLTHKLAYLHAQGKPTNKSLGLCFFCLWSMDTSSEVTYRCTTLASHRHTPDTCLELKSKVSNFSHPFSFGHFNKKCSRHFQEIHITAMWHTYMLKAYPQTKICPCSEIPLPRKKEKRKKSQLDVLRFLKIGN